MNYLLRQFELVKRASKAGIPLTDILAIKYYIQTLMSETIAMHLKPSSKVLEIGVGGSLTIHFLSRMGYECHAIDNNEEFIRYSTFLKNNLNTSVFIVLADAFSLPYPNKSFDYVYSVGAIEHYPNYQQIEFCKEMSRVSKKYVHIEVPNYNMSSAFYSILLEESEIHYPYNLELILHNNGYKVVEKNGRGVFNILKMLEKNDSLYSYIKKNHSELIATKFRESHIDKLINRERDLNIEDRMKYGFQIYTVGEYIG